MSACLGTCVVAYLVNPLDLQRLEEALDGGVVPAIRPPAHGHRDAEDSCQLAVFMTCILGEFNPSSQHIQNGGVHEAEDVEIEFIVAT